MIVMVSGAIRDRQSCFYDPHIGVLVQPRSWASMSRINDSDKEWGIDNDAFGGWTKEKSCSFGRLLGQVCLIRPCPLLRFVACPDCVGDATETNRMFERWSPIISASRLPVGFVLQDGETRVPSDCDAVFVGGTTDFKLSGQAERLIEQAKNDDKWVHVGRVNTFKRLRHFYDIGVDSIDGTAFSRWPDVHLPKVLSWLARLEQQPTLNNF